MKKLTLFIFNLTFCLSLMADDQSSGCGLGWALFKENTIISSLSRAYTNITFSSTFGMTSGTSGCAKHSLVKADKKQIHYTESNYHTLMADMALGQGEFIQTYAQVMGCPENLSALFMETLKNNYSHIYTASHMQKGHAVASQEVLNNVITEIQNHPILAENCRLTII